MTEFWENAFQGKKQMWGNSASLSAKLASNYFIEQKVKSVLIPGVGYGRNALPFLNAGMSVEGIEISQTAINLARNELKLSFPIHHGSVTNMPFNKKTFDGIFCYALIHLLNAQDRKTVIKSSFELLNTGGVMAFTVISKKSPSYGKGTQISTDRFEQHQGVQMFFYDESSIKQEFEEYGLVNYKEIEESIGKGSETKLPFYIIFCKK